MKKSELKQLIKEEINKLNEMNKYTVVSKNLKNQKWGIVGEFSSTGTEPEAIKKAMRKLTRDGVDCKQYDFSAYPTDSKELKNFIDTKIK